MNCCVKRVAKYQGATPQYSYGTCSRIWLGLFVNENVNGVIRTPSGLEVEISESARMKIREKWNQMRGRPFKVIINRDCSQDCAMMCMCILACGPYGPCCYSIFCTNGSCQCNCADPVNLQWARVHELWFADKSDESICSGCSSCVANSLLCGCPLICSKCLISKVSIDPDDINLVSMKPMGQFIVDITADINEIRLNIPVSKLAPVRQLMVMSKSELTSSSNVNLVPLTELPPQYNAAPPVFKTT
jgi:hypothetical protein